MELTGGCILFFFVVLPNLFNLGTSQWQIWLGKSVERLTSCALCIQFTWWSFKFFNLFHQKWGFPQKIWKTFINENINSVAFVILCTLDLYIKIYFSWISLTSEYSYQLTCVSVNLLVSFVGGTSSWASSLCSIREVSRETFVPSFVKEQLLF